MNALDVITDQLFDYAGMFPPAALAFNDGLKLTSTSAGLLHRPRIKAADYVVTWEHLQQLTVENIRAKGFQGSRFRIALLGSDIEDDFERYLDELREAAEWGQSSSDETLTIEIESFEVKCLDSTRSFLRFLSTRHEELEEVAGVWTGRLFFESNALLRGSSTELSESLSTIQHLNQSTPDLLSGLKIRGAGPTSVNNSEIAALIDKWRTQPIPLKATAGLHHPIIERDRYGNDLGFLNVICALLLASADE